MSGVLFLICIPTSTYEKILRKRAQEKVDKDDQTTDCDSHSDINEIRSSQEPLFTNSGDHVVHIEVENFSISRAKSQEKFGLDSCMSPLKKALSKSWGNFKEAVSPRRGSAASSEEPGVKDCGTMEQILTDVLSKLFVQNAVWYETKGRKHIQVIFPIESERCDETLEVLRSHGVGSKMNSLISMVPCSMYNEKNEDKDMVPDSENFDEKKEHAKNSAWNRFLASIRARLTVAHVVEGIKADATLTFDFLLLLVVATMLSALALTENTNIYLLASVLISPLMGPVMAGTFGTVVQDKKLQKMGVQNELIGLGIATLIGFSYGIICSVAGKKDGDWPTYEMISRGEVDSLWVGCVVALLSGTAVALGILGHNICYIGVAISASLLPPAVNAGLLWAMASVSALAGSNTKTNLTLTGLYSDNEALELAALGGISMCLTLINIVCIFVAGILVLKIKEVAPMSTKDVSRRFWKHDIKIARDYNRTLQNEDAATAAQNLQTELSKYRTSAANTVPQDAQTEGLFQRRVDMANSQTWTPCMRIVRRPTVKELQELYLNLMDRSSSHSLNFPFKETRAHTRYSWIDPTYPQTYVSVPEDNSAETKYEEQYSPSGSGRRIVSGKRKFVVTPIIDHDSDVPPDVL